MKKTLLTIATCMALCITAKGENNIFNHLGVGIEAGTTGIGFEVATPITDYVQVRAGMAIMPSITVKDIEVDINADDVQWDLLRDNIPGCENLQKPQDVLIDGKITKTDFKLLFDIFPFKKSSFHVTAGFYAGKSQLIEAYTTNNQGTLQAITDFNQMVTNGEIVNPFGYPIETIGVELGDYKLEPYGDQANAFIKVKSFKPYLGIGFGRAVPKKTRLAFAFDMGVQFWSTPELFVKQKDGNKKLTEEAVGSDDGGFIKTMSKITVYPCLNFRLTGRIF